MKTIWESYDGKDDLFISANAGTGKTYTISSIYVSLFDRAFRHGRELGVENVVTITFTRKAAREMKKKIVEMIEKRVADSDGPVEVWNRLLSSMIFSWISTIDAFAYRILTESGLLVGIDPSFKIASQAQMNHGLHRAVLWTLSEHLELLEPLLELYTVDQVVERLMNAIASHRYNLQTSRVITSVDLELPIHADRDTESLLKKVSEHFHRLFELSYEAYLQELEKEKLMDFTEVLMTLKRVLSDPRNEWLRERYRRQFKYIIVDEFQDTNFLQKEIIDLLRGRDTKVVYVGDDKQSIYRFRGAEVEVFSKARREVEKKGGSVHHLSTNFRSHPLLVEFNNRLFSRVFLEGKDYAPSYHPSEPLKLDGADSGRPRVKLLIVEDVDEAEAVAGFIKSLVGKPFEFVERKTVNGETVLVLEKRRVRYADITVLFRKGKGVISKYTHAFEHHGIPYYVVGETGFFDLPEIVGFLSFVKLIGNPLDDLAMVSALLSPLVGLDLDDLLKLRRAANVSATGKALFHGLDGVMFEGLKGERFELFKRVLYKYIPLRSMMKLSELLESIVDELDYEPHLARFDPSGRRLANLRKFVSTARKLDEPGISLRELMRRLRHFGPEDEEQASIESEETDAVQMMTVHKAKGLEFPIVVVVDTSWSVKEPWRELVFYRDRAEGDNVFILSPKGLAEGIEDDETVLGRVASEEREREIEEEKRTLYVALTRAIDMTVLTFVPKMRNRRSSRAYWRDLLTNHLVVYDGERVELADGFEDLVEMVSPTSMMVEGITRGESEATPLRISAMYTDDLEDRSYKEYIAPTTLTSEIAPTLLVTDVELLERDESTSSRDLGILVHQVLEPLGDGMTLESLLNSKPASIDALRFTAEDFEKVRVVLSRLKDHGLIREIENSHCLSEFELTKPFGKYMLFGKLDKIVETPNGWKIVDFKFSDSSSHTEKYEFQMKFYLYLARDIFKPLLKASLFYLKDGAVKNVTLEDEEIEDFEDRLREEIERYHREIRKHR